VVFLLEEGPALSAEGYDLSALDGDVERILIARETSE